jgi:hypothetical protein
VEVAFTKLSTQLWVLQCKWGESHAAAVLNYRRRLDGNIEVTLLRDMDAELLRCKHQRAVDALVDEDATAHRATKHRAPDAIVNLDGGKDRRQHYSALR